MSLVQSPEGGLLPTEQMVEPASQYPRLRELGSWLLTFVITVGLLSVVKAVFGLSVSLAVASSAFCFCIGALWGAGSVKVKDALAISPAGDISERNIDQTPSTHGHRGEP